MIAFEDRESDWIIQGPARAEAKSSDRPIVAACYRVGQEESVLFADLNLNRFAR